MISLLDEQTINQIAAGEVIENTASVIKELVENSIDAGATKVTIEILAGGRQQITIVDDGHGIHFHEMPIALMRHATSKIVHAEDLAVLSTRGFRGEALSSVASISKMKIFSKTSEGKGGFLQQEGGVVLEHTEVPCDAGTKIEIYDLFYNTPVRKKFLKSVESDALSVMKMVQNLALAHPHISFHLINHHKTVLKVFQESLKERIVSLLGEEYIAEMVPLFYKDKVVTIEGYLSLPHKTRQNRTGQYIIVNHRVVSCPLLQFALHEAFGSMLENKRYPLFVLMMTIDSDLVDVNVHPQKKEIRLRKEALIRALVKATAEQALYKAPPFEPLEPSFSFEPPPIFIDERAPLSLPSAPPAYFMVKREPVQEKEEQITFMPKIAFLGEWQHYLFIDLEDKLYLIDKKRLARRVLYEELSSSPKHFNKQMGVFPETLTFSLSEAALLQEKQEIRGIDLKLLTPTTFQLVAYPPHLSSEEVRSLLVTLIYEGEELFLQEMTYARLPHEHRAASDWLFAWEKLGRPPFCPRGKKIATSIDPKTIL